MAFQFEQDELVRIKTGSTYWIAKIIAINENSLTVEYFGDGQQYQISRQEAVPFTEFLQQQKRARKLKIVYNEFFGRLLERMPRARLNELHQVLQEHGVAFDESVTRADDSFQMWPNTAHLTPRERQKWKSSTVLPETITLWLPKWLVVDPLPPYSRDPLGLQAGAGQLADDLLPGLTVFTNRVGYFFFLSWAIRELNRDDGMSASERRECLNRLERALVLSEVVYHGKDELKSCYHQGQRAKMRLLAEVTTDAAIPDRILKNQNNTGCYNLYRTAMRSCGFWQDDDEAALAGRLPFRLTSRGEKLASAFARRKGVAELLKWAQDNTGPRKVQTLQGWGQSVCFQTFCKQTDKKCFLDGFLFAKDDQVDVVNDADRRLQTLRTLSAVHLLFASPTTEATATLISQETAGADVIELEEAPNQGENVAFLLHFYRNRNLPGSDLFVAAAIYELLSLALNAVWADLTEYVIDRGRISLAGWCKDRIEGSTTLQFWKTPFKEAATVVPTSEEQLVNQLMTTKAYQAERGLMLAVKVLGQAGNQGILDGPLAETDLRAIVEIALLAQAYEPVQTLVVSLISHLIDHHHLVSERKGRECWLVRAGDEVWPVAARAMALGFHSYRLPQLMSLVRDLNLTEQDLYES
ncbi:MAG: hypothetical protein BroJett011_07440 [Chloroflexota bacterium]|nr:MAG: hypothetical protein BroJett011_07440 [Chloroflexota bacterium]